jgi:hypothetical protein
MNAKRFLIPSLLLNLGLAAAAAVLLFRPTSPGAGPDAQPGRKAVTLTQKITRTRQISEPNQVTPLDWKQIESDDYKTYIANLRATGCPEETIRDIVIADINKHYVRRWRQLNPFHEYKYWRHGRSSGDDPVREANNRRKALDGLLKEKRELVRSLLGVDLAEDGERYGDPSFRGSSADMTAFDFLSPEKRQMFREIRDRYDPQIQQYLDNLDPDNYMPPDVRRQITALRSQAEAEMQRALSPEEWEQFQLRFSGTAQRMRGELAGFEPGEEEFRRLFAMRQAMDDQLQKLDAGGEEAQRLRAEANRKLDEDIKAVLSPERYAAYKLTTDAAYRQALDFTRAWDLPKETASALFAIQKAAETQVGNLRTVSEQERPAAVAQLRGEVERTLRDTLGEKAFKSYRRNQFWLRALGQ